ncbi:bifunctional 4-hydroxy-2-oxoglutarate aldolase/2-dehydro-3-deoxy-phosphogluconate aldolase [Colwellia echini]|uniref:Bifunctional 4-hydroxy-2-oxoglutarate aldolase/2-dehydro-3-deoxy-phosphogluconate aldolase n=1 Tax=Colwellia echini TaxID=1982103 RepID=A0ABY3MVB3_9GAMM|nr:bifunctional 4-hydroxy-2-oxoglutarate aldolase/2-dehydro-3-deoxy-phosphogluconate aldolase [Colwellia echini]TYK65129.1 bifunctional 4-hydroxy-2-oxoglutarate aldolase/2-dehydro-3-deoxy-phosphogluconate aldolase [Colwellia echini]
MSSFSSLMGTQTLLPIIQANTAEEGLNIAKAMGAAGINLVEVVLRTPASYDVIKLIKQELPDMIVGAGTILDEAILTKALEAGSDFIITPATSAKLYEALAKCPVPVVPGVSNASDILLAYENGYTEVKLFPASLAGGVPFLNAMSSVFQTIKFCPTGGVNAANKSEFLSLPNVIAVGGTWVADKKWVQNEDWAAITAACVDALN